MFVFEAGPATKGHLGPADGQGNQLREKTSTMETTATTGAGGTTAARIHEPAVETPPPQTPPAQTTTSVLGLVRGLGAEIRTFIHQELQLAQTELSEKTRRLGRKAAGLGIGAFIAYAGAIVVLLGLGFLVAWAIHLAGIQALFACFLGLLVTGLGGITVGGILVINGLITLSREPLKPQRTLQTLQELKTSQPAAQLQPSSAPAPTSAEMQSRVEATEDRLGETLDELGRRLSPQRLSAEVKQRIQANPYRSGLIALGAGLLSGLLLRRRLRHGQSAATEWPVELVGLKSGKGLPGSRLLARLRAPAPAQ